MQLFGGDAAAGYATRHDNAGSGVAAVEFMPQVIGFRHCDSEFPLWTKRRLCYPIRLFSLA